jgi:hypothetical protein
MPDMPTFLLQFVGWLLNPKTIKFAIAGLIALALIGYGFWSWETIKTLKATQSSLVTTNKTLVQNNNILVANDNALQAKWAAVSTDITKLTNQYGQSQQQQQQTYQNIVAQPTPPGQTPNTQDMENRANTGINTLFDDLNSLSQTGNTAAPQGKSK